MTYWHGYDSLNRPHISSRVDFIMNKSNRLTQTATGSLAFVGDHGPESNGCSLWSCGETVSSETAEIYKENGREQVRRTEAFRRINKRAPLNSVCNVILVI